MSSIFRCEGEQWAYLVFSIDSIAATNASSRPTAWRLSWCIIPPIGSALSIWAISRHVSCVSAHATNNIGREVALFWAVILPMPNLATYMKLDPIWFELVDHLQFWHAWFSSSRKVPFKAASSRS